MIGHLRAVWAEMREALRGLARYYVGHSDDIRNR